MGVPPRDGHGPERRKRRPALSWKTLTIEELEREYPDMHVHDSWEMRGMIGGKIAERKLVWETYEDSIDDGGESAIAEIIRWPVN